VHSAPGVSGVMACSAPVLIACAGNPLVGDDAAGAEVFARLKAVALPERVRLVELGVSALKLLEELAGGELLIVVDAVSLGAPEGTVHVFEWDQLPRAGAAVTCHGIGLFESLEIVRRLYPERMPSRAILVGIEGRRFDELGAAPGPEVLAGIERAARVVQNFVECAAHEIG
jgi:hydrogenase maturation protease